MKKVVMLYLDISVSTLKYNRNLMNAILRAEGKLIKRNVEVISLDDAPTTLKKLFTKMSTMRLSLTKCQLHRSRK